MAVPKGRRNQTGHVSVKNTAIPNDSGTAMSIASPALVIVPTMAMAAPNSSLMMSHSTYQMKRAPNFAKVGQALMNKETIIPANARRTMSEKTCVIRWNSQSWVRWRSAVLSKWAAWAELGRGFDMSWFTQQGNQFRKKESVGCAQATNGWIPSLNYFWICDQTLARISLVKLSGNGT